MRATVPARSTKVSTARSSASRMALMPSSSSRLENEPLSAHIVAALAASA